MRPKANFLRTKSTIRNVIRVQKLSPEVGLDQTAVVVFLRLGQERQVLQESEHRVRR